MCMVSEYTQCSSAAAVGSHVVDHICCLLALQLLQGELDSLKAERGKAQRKNTEVRPHTICRPALAPWSPGSFCLAHLLLLGQHV